MDTKTMETRKIEEELNNSLLYQMSLGSRELYHSNVWAWLMKNDSNFVKVFFPNFNDEDYSVTSVERENNHRDIIIRFQKKEPSEKKEKYFYVIENKIKSLHNKGQLEKYSKDLGDHSLLEGAFTGIENNLEEKEITFQKSEGNKVAWHFVSYADIAERILNCASDSQNELIKAKFAQIEEYCGIIENIYRLLDDELKKNPKRLIYDCDEALAELKLEDIFIKLKGAHFFQYVMKNLTMEEFESNGFHHDSNSRVSFNNKKATLDFRFTNWSEEDTDYTTIGIQIERYQYRFLVQRNGTHSKDEVFEAYKEKKWFDENFDPTQKERFLFDKPTKLKGSKGSKGKKYDGYEGDAYVFVYQYYDINNDNNQYDDILSAIRKDLEKLKKIFDNKE